MGIYPRSCILQLNVRLATISGVGQRRLGLRVKFPSAPAGLRTLTAKGIGQGRRQPTTIHPDGECPRSLSDVNLLDSVNELAEASYSEREAGAMRDDVPHYGNAHEEAKLSGRKGCHRRP